jgi:4-diphosphocytidyl-2-C-methyl-D-erythritol kinase
MGMGLEIGTDVPFFFWKGAAIASGIGERLKKVDLPDLWYVLIYPNFEVSTRWAYHHFVLTNQQIHFNLHKFIKTPEGISHILFNHFEGVVARRYPQVGVMKKILFSAGALGTLMTGSGPTVFGVFQDSQSMMEGYEKIKKPVARRGWIVFKAHSLI